MHKSVMDRGMFARNDGYVTFLCPNNSYVTLFYVTYHIKFFFLMK